MQLKCAKHGTVNADPDRNHNVMCPICRETALISYLKKESTTPLAIDLPDCPPYSISCAPRVDADWACFNCDCTERIPQPIKSIPAHLVKESSSFDVWVVIITIVIIVTSLVLFSMGAWRG